jgi:hypothetical protein
MINIAHLTINSHLSAWCVGGLVPFMIDVAHLRIKPLALVSDHGRRI